MQPQDAVQRRPVAEDQPGSPVGLDHASHPGFYGDPYATYERIRAVLPAFYWEEQGLWCFLNAADVGAILRDRRFGRELSPCRASRALPPGRSPAHVEAFHEVNQASMLEREPPVHTRLRTLVNRAFVSRNIERLRPRISRAGTRADRGDPAARTRPS